MSLGWMQVKSWTASNDAAAGASVYSGAIRRAGSAPDYGLPANVARYNDLRADHKFFLRDR
jgi:hypothetical protein